MAERFTSLLTDPAFLERASASDVLADALQSPESLQTMVVAERRGNDLAAAGTRLHDLNNMNYWQLDEKYGREVADNRHNLQTEA